MSTLQKILKSILEVIVYALCLIPLAAHSAPEKSYKDERTGQDCVQAIAKDPTNPFQPSKYYGYIYLKNTCSRSFAWTATFNNGKVRGSGIGPGSTAHISCERAAGECDSEILWEVR